MWGVGIIAGFVVFQFHVVLKDATTLHTFLLASQYVVSRPDAGPGHSVLCGSEFRLPTMGLSWFCVKVGLGLTVILS